LFDWSQYLTVFHNEWLPDVAMNGMLLDVSVLPNKKYFKKNRPTTNILF